MSDEEFAKFIRNYHNLPLAQHKSCNDCAALCTLEPNYIKNKLHLDVTKLKSSEINKDHFICGCLLTFEQRWVTWGQAIPLESCPKPKTKDELLVYAGFLS